MKEDLKLEISGAQAIPSEGESKEVIIAAVVANIRAMIAADRKVTALKELQVSFFPITWTKYFQQTYVPLLIFCEWQGHIWRSGYSKGELLGAVFDDVPRALSRWNAAGSKVTLPWLHHNSNISSWMKCLCLS